MNTYILGMVATLLEAHGVARIDAQRLRRTNTRVRDILARWQITRRRINSKDFTGRLITVRERRRSIGAAGTAKGAGGQVLTGDTLALDTRVTK